jgi:hypothetical protein
LAAKTFDLNLDEIVPAKLFEAGDLLRRVLEGAIERMGLPEEILLTEAFHRRCVEP